MQLAVCICTCNRPEGLARCLEAIGRSDRDWLDGADRAFVLVVDNRPGGPTPEICAAAAARSPFPILCVEEPEPGISFARNRAVREALARGADLVAFLDDDDHPTPGWLRELVAVRRTTGAELVFGVCRPNPGASLPGWLADIKPFQPPRLDGVNRFGLPAWAGTYNVLIARPLIERLAPDGTVFLPEFAFSGGEDTDLFIRAHRDGAKIATAPGSHVVRGHDDERFTLGGILRRGFRFGTSRHLLNRRHDPERANWRRFYRNLVDIAGLVFGLPLHAGSRRGLVAQLYQIANLLGENHAYLGGRYGYYQALPPR